MNILKEIIRFPLRIVFSLPIIFIIPLIGFIYWILNDGESLSDIIKDGYKCLVLPLWGLK